MLIDGIGNATLVNGIVRIEMLQRNAKGEDIVTGELAIPVNRITAVTRGLANLTNQLAARIKAAPTDETAEAVAAAAEPDTKAKKA